MQLALKTPTLETSALLSQTAPVSQPALAPNESSPSEGSLAGNSLLRFITCGSVDDGKSTLIGRVLYEAGAVFDDQLDALDKDSKKFGTTGDLPDFALLVDGLSAEREQGITIDVAYRYFQTPRRAFIVADTPGHEQYTRNMATGASTADVAIILIDARKGVLPQTRRHSFIVSLVGVKRIIVAVNKMDLVGYAESTFRQIEAEYRKAVAGLGFEAISVLPVSALAGENITSRSSKMAWSTSLPLLPLLEEIEIGAPTQAQKGFGGQDRSSGYESLAFPVQWVNRPNLDFRGFAGTIAQGSINTGDEITVLPSGKTSRVKRIVTHDGDLESAFAGQAITLTLQDEIDVSRGDVLISGSLQNVRPRQEICARVLITAEQALKAGDQMLVKLGTAFANVTVTALHHAVDIETYAQVEATQFPMNTIGLASLRFDRPLVVSDYTQNQDLGGFLLIDRASNQTLAFGFVAMDQAPALRAIAVERSPDGLAQKVQHWLGSEGSDRRHKRIVALVWAGLSALILGALVGWITSSGVIGLVAGLIDLVLRPVLREGHAAFWARLRARQLAAANLDAGEGI